MNIGELFLSLGIKGDTKGLDVAIKKVSELEKKTKDATKALKDFDSALAVKTSIPKLSNSGFSRSGVGSSIKDWEKDIKREEAVKDKRFKLEERREKERERERLRQEKDQKKQEKERERATKNFFRQIDNGFSSVARTFLTALGGTAIGGFITSKSAQSVESSNLLRQFNIDPDFAQRIGNVFRVGSGRAVSKQDTNGLLSSLSLKLADNDFLSSMVGDLAAVGLSPTEVRDPKSLFSALRRVSKDGRFQEKYFTALTSKLGIAPEFSQALNSKTFSDENFQQAYNLPVASNTEIESARKINIKFAELENALDKLTAVLLHRFAPTIIGITEYIKNKLTPEAAEEVTKAATVFGGAWALTKIGKFAVNNPMAAYATVGYGAWKGLSHLADRNEQLLHGKAKKNKNKQKEYIADFGENNGSWEWRNDYTPEEIEHAKKYTAINNAANVTNNVTTNVTASTVDKDSAPIITEATLKGMRELQNKGTNSIYTQQSYAR